MKRIVIMTVWAVVFQVSYCQNEKLSAMENYLEKSGFDLSHIQRNAHGRVCHVWHCYMNAGATRSVVEFREDGEDVTVSTPETDSINAAQANIILAALDSIRRTFSTLAPLSAESYLYEYHKHDADSIKYSLAFARENTDSMGTWQEDNLAYFPNAREMAHLDYFRVYDGRFEGYWQNCNYDHWLMVGDSIPEAQMRSFDTKAFSQLVQSFMKPVLKKKGIKAYPLCWQHDGDPKSFVKQDLMLYEQSDEIDYGLTTGTHYLLPAKYKEMAMDLLEQLRILTLDYVNSHPEQLYTYYYDLGIDKEYPWSLWKVICGFSHSRWNAAPSYQLRCSIDEDGLHIVSMITDGELWIPKDWKTLKSYVNGKKVYRKGKEPK